MLQIIRELDDSKFEPLKKHWSDTEKLDQMYKNMWSMFDWEEFKKSDTDDIEEQFLDALLEKKERLSVNDFGWTKEVEEQFYDHPYHKAFVKRCKKYSHLSWQLSLFILDEPSLVK